MNRTTSFVAELKTRLDLGAGVAQQAIVERSRGQFNIAQFIQLLVMLAVVAAVVIQIVTR